MLGLGPRHQVAAFVRQVLRHVAYRGPGRRARPAGRRAHAAQRKVRAAAPEHPRHAGLKIRLQQQAEFAELLRDLGVALDAYVAALDHRLRVRAAERQQRQRRADDRRVGASAGEAP